MMQAVVFYEADGETVVAQSALDPQAVKALRVGETYRIRGQSWNWTGESMVKAHHPGFNRAARRQAAASRKASHLSVVK